MKKVYLKGYINSEENSYTFIYENNILTLISIENKPTFFNEYKYVEYFKGFTLNGFDIVFYINNNISYRDGCFTCLPRCILITQSEEYRLDEMEFASLNISGGVLNRFYSNRKMIEFDEDKYWKDKKDYFKFKTVEEIVSEENVNLNGTETVFELSIKQAGWKDDGRITFNDYDSVLRIKYDSSKNYASIVKDLASIENFLKFCANRNKISVDSVFLEIKNTEEKYIKSVEIFIPYMIDNEINKDILRYDLLENYLNGIFAFLDESDYLFSIIPDDNKSFETISNKDYCSVISCFQSIYQYTYENKEKSNKILEEIKLDEVKNEILPILAEINNNYKGKDSVKRNFIERFIHIIKTANLKLEKCINEKIEENNYLIDTIYYKRRDKIKVNEITKCIIQSIENRDYITHKKTIKLDDISIGMYEIIYKLNYIMILNYVGIENDKIKKEIQYLALRNII